MKRGLRNGVAPYIPAAFCRDAGSAGHGATEAARPERSLQARGFASGMEARQGGDSFAGSVHDSPPRQGDARKRHKQENNKTDNSKRLARTVLIFTEKSDQLSRATDRVPGLPASPGYAQ